ncbi:MAG: hypothetical protein QXE16_02155 [Candidatus Bathyarchaeia archaeon]
MDDFEEALRNIDVFCRVLVEKLAESEKESEDGNVPVEPIENLLKRKYTVEESIGDKIKIKCFIPLPHVEEPLIDIFEDDNCVRILLQCRCRDQKVTVQRDVDGLQLCLEDRCWKINLPLEQLQMDNMVMACNNNAAFEVDIPKLNHNTLESRIQN